jgi:hypothetical protein
MFRMFALVAALLITGLTMASAGLAHFTNDFRFTLRDLPGGRVQLEVRSAESGRGTNSSNAFAPQELSGLDLEAVRASGSRPVRFAMIREAGRVDCAGNGGHGHAAGRCSFTADPGFANLLVSRGIRRPNLEESFTLAMVRASRALVDAVHQARYPTPSPDTLAGLAAVGVDAAYIADLSRRGYRPAKIDDLIAFRALNVTPAYVDAMSRAGYGRLEAQDILAFKAIGVSPEYVAAMARIGYPRLTAEDLTQLKALNVTPEFVTGFRNAGYANLSAEDLVQLKALGITPEFAADVRNAGTRPLSVQQLVHLKLSSFEPRRRR